MAYFNALSMGMAGMFVRGISEIAELLVAIRRIEGFLMNEEFVPAQTSIIANGKENGYSSTKSMIYLRDFSAKWNKRLTEIVLKHINININSGSLFGIIGPVGSGKSALLQAILGIF